MKRRLSQSDDRKSSQRTLKIVRTSKYWKFVFFNLQFFTCFCSLVPKNFFFSFVLPKTFNITDVIFFIFNSKFPVSEVCNHIRFPGCLLNEPVVYAILTHRREWIHIIIERCQFQWIFVNIEILSWKWKCDSRG